MNFFGWEEAQQGQKYQTRPGRARVEEQELETALPQSPMASGVQFPFQLIMPYGRCPKKRALKSLNELDAKDQNSQKDHIQYRCPPWDILENTAGYGQSKRRIRLPSCPQ